MYVSIATMYSERSPLLLLAPAGPTAHPRLGERELCLRPTVPIVLVLVLSSTHISSHAYARPPLLASSPMALKTRGLA